MAETQPDVGDREAGEWLFQRDGKLFGPLPAAVLVERLERGELSAETPIAPEGGAFRPLREVPAFVVHVARLEAHRKVHGEVAAARRAERRRVLRRGIVWGGVAVAVAAGVAAGVIAFARSRGAGPVPAEVRVSAPLIAVAAGREAGAGGGGGEGDLLDYLEGEPATGPRRSGRIRPPAGGPSRSRADADGLATASSYDEGAMNQVIRANQARLVGCVKEQAARDPGFRGEVPLTFTVENDGRVGKLWVDKPGYATGDFQACVKARLAEWHFPAFAGERPSISLNFRVGP
jgi:hypothetical protein